MSWIDFREHRASAPQLVLRQVAQQVDVLKQLGELALTRAAESRQRVETRRALLELDDLTLADIGLDRIAILHDAVGRTTIGR